MRFEHPTNGYVETCSMPFLWALIFGPLYFLLKGIWRHVVLYFVVNSILIAAWWMLAIAAISATSFLAVYASGRNPETLTNLALIATTIVPVGLVAPFLIYPFLATGIVRRHILRQGWSEVA